METLGFLAHGFAVAFTPLNIVLALIGCFLGTIIGALPGLGPVNGVAILIPVAFSLQLAPASALILLSCVYYGCMYGGRISSIMLNIPGDEPAMMTCLDGYPMAQKGKAPEALAISAIASFVGAILATIGLVLFAPLLVRFAIHFGPAEYFALYVLAFATIGGITGTNPAKTLLAAALGLALGTVGIDPQSGVPRFTFGVFELFDGFDAIVAIVGLFAISEVLVLLEEGHGGISARAVRVSRAFAQGREIAASAGAMLRGSVIGFVAGVLPGAGASLGSFLAYTMEKRYSDRRGTFGKGDPRGVAAPEAGNNAAAGGALVPMLSLGVPGSGTTAVLLALLISLNITPGPLLFQKEPDVVWGLIASLFFANFVLIAMNLPLVGLFTRMLAIPMWALMPFVVMVSFVGIYSISHSPFDLFMMVLFGVLGYVLRKLAIPVVPVVLGLLLGADMESNFRRALSISGGDYAILFQSGIAIGLYVLTLLFLALAVFLGMRERRPPGAEPEPAHD
ncbi:tripartite tricarboxylate transporter permease [Propylenella binzhouense]|uniref:Tripartite tricarboxylate transporter permease n=1 Tax=Propylenella binzhouense TaxID=2555902 RepID=A0A964T7K0_9HYPH|nr:tripartite tricarboxylate transporter permease [Propylenella binzhouense]MYZ49996.1 tripartite tricarboxylate transporter permease [Propylenella binzhouense]